MRMTDPFPTEQQGIEPTHRLDWEAMARFGQPIILYMPMSQLAEVAASLQRGGLAADTPAALIQSATSKDERVVESTLGRLVADAERHGIGSPSIVVIGTVVGLRADLLKTMVGWQ